MLSNSDNNKFVWLKLIWFDLSVYYDLSSVQIHKALYKFLKSHWWCIFREINVFNSVIL